VHQVRQAPLTGQLTGQATPLGSVKAPPGSSPTPTSADAVEHASLSLDVDGLSGSISRTLSDGNGTYTVVVAMHPSDLGQVRAVLSLDGNDLAVSITPQSQAGHAALTNAADALKNQLAAGGLTVNVTLRDPGSPSGDDGQHANEPSGAGPTPATSSTPPPLAVPVLAAGQIHLML
jgi:flagellar hook-length control protein FliK